MFASIRRASRKNFARLESSPIAHWCLQPRSITKHSTALPKRNVLSCMLSAKYVQYIHDNLVMVMWPGSDPLGTGGCRDLNLLESAVARPFQSAFGVDAYPTILEKA